MAKYNNPRKTWKYSNDFKVNAVQLSFVVGITIKTVAQKHRCFTGQPINDGVLLDTQSIYLPRHPSLKYLIHRLKIEIKE